MPARLTTALATAGVTAGAYLGTSAYAAGRIERVPAEARQVTWGDGKVDDYVHLHKQGFYSDRTLIQGLVVSTAGWTGLASGLSVLLLGQERPWSQLTAGLGGHELLGGAGWKPVAAGIAMGSMAAVAGGIAIARWSAFGGGGS